MPPDGWEWPFLLLILSRFPDDLIGEREAVLEFADFHIAWRTGRLDDLDALRRRYQGEAP